jgi:hypothetical protein
MLLLAIMWTVVLLCDIVSLATGGSPSWIMVFCPLVVLVFRCWEEFLEGKSL